MRPPNAWQEASLAGRRGSRGGPRARTSARTCARSRVRPRVRSRALLRPRTRARPRREISREDARDIARDVARKVRDFARELASRPAREIASRPARDLARGNGATPRRDSRGIPARLTYPPRLSFVSHLPTSEMTFTFTLICHHGKTHSHRSRGDAIPVQRHRGCRRFFGSGRKMNARTVTVRDHRELPFKNPAQQVTSTGTASAGKQRSKKAPRDDCDALERAST